MENTKAADPQLGLRGSFHRPIKITMTSRRSTALISVSVTRSDRSGGLFKVEAKFLKGYK